MLKWIGCAAAVIAIMMLGGAPPDGSAGLAADGPTAEALSYEDLYRYDADLPLEVQVASDGPRGQARELRLSYTSTHHERVPAVLLLPPSPEGPVPVIYLLHGMGGSKNMVKHLDLLCRGGYGVFAIDAQYHGERKRPDAGMFAPRLYQSREALIQTVVDVRRGLDYLGTRADVDPRRIVLVGVSMGGILGAVTLGVEPRFSAAVLMVAGGDWSKIQSQSIHPSAVAARNRPGFDLQGFAEAMRVCEPLYFMRRAAPRPLLFLLGKEDHIVPAECGRALYEAAPQPKKVVWFDSGHFLPPRPALEATESFLREVCRMSALQIPSEVPDSWTGRLKRDEAPKIAPEPQPPAPTAPQPATRRYY